MTSRLRSLRFLLLFWAVGFSMVRGGEKVRPLFREFTGLCGHTVQFRPELYQPVCRVVRDYHPVKWDLGDDTAVLPEWPFAKNRVSWEKVYGDWHARGLKISACLMFDDMKPGDWKDLPRDARAYGREFARHFGPGGKWPFVETVEIGNEPGHWSDEDYLKLLAAMASGIREGNPRMKIATCNIEAGGSDRYWKGADILRPHLPSLDVLRIHRYAIKDGWPVWRRSYPEDAAVPYLSHIRDMLRWRDTHAPHLPLWVSEFGWDCSTQTPDPQGDMAKFIDCTDEEQAMWLVRSYLLFSEMGVDKAFAYFFNDDDKPTFHGCSGITRNFQPKPSYHALAWMLASLGDYRFSAALQNGPEAYLYEFAPEKPGQPHILAAWHATRDGVELPLELKGRKLLRAQQMPLTAGPVKPQPPAADARTITAGTRPVFLWVK